MKNICVDFDDTLCNWSDVTPGFKMGKPFPDAKEALEKFKEMGYTVVIFSAKALSQVGSKIIKDWLDYFEIPYDEITCVKKSAEFYIDDHAVRFEGNWSDTFLFVKNRMEDEE